MSPMVRQAHHEVFEKLTMRINSLKTLNLILSPSKDEARFQQPAETMLPMVRQAHHED